MSRFKEFEYRNLSQRDFETVFKKFLIFLSLVFTINMIFYYCSQDTFISLSSATIVITVLLILITVALYTRIDKIKLNVFLFFVCVCIGIIQALFETENSISLIYPVLIVLFGISINSIWTLGLLQVLILSLISIIIYSTESPNESSKVQLIRVICWTVFIFCLSFLSVVISYARDLSNRNEFVFLKNVEIKVRKAQNVLSYLLPEFVRKRVKDGVRYIAEDKGTVSVIFIDICNFDYIVNSYNPRELLIFLDDVFGKIDKICENLGVTKIETVGKTYLACAGLKDSESHMDQSLLEISHARRAVEMSLEVLRELEKIKLKDNSSLLLKIGINSGPVTAGVVGYHKPQFSLVGDTVNTASRMASTLTEYNTIQISLSTYDLLEDLSGLTFSNRSPEVKGKGIMQTKIVEIPNFFGATLDSPVKIKKRSGENFTPTMKIPENPARNSRNSKNSLYNTLGITKDKELFQLATRVSYKFYDFL